MEKFAFILSGGTLKGCFQVGALEYIINEQKIIPDALYGTSVGSLNAAYLVNEIGKVVAGGKQPDVSDWSNAVTSLKHFWIRKIRETDDVVIERGKLDDLIRIWRKRFDGLTDTAPMNQKINTTLDVPKMAKSGIQLTVVAVDLVSGGIVYGSPDREDDFLDCLKGSMALPVIMPAVTDEDDGGVRRVMLDGGIRAVAPFGKAINDQCRNLIGILCQAEDVDVLPGFNQGDVFKLMDRIEDIVVNQNLRNDAGFAQVITHLVCEAKDAGVYHKIPTLTKYQTVTSCVIQPLCHFDVDLHTFGTHDIKHGIKLGYQAAEEYFRTHDPQWVV